MQTSRRPALLAFVACPPAAPQRVNEPRGNSEGVKGDAKSEDPKY